MFFIFYFKFLFLYHLKWFPFYSFSLIKSWRTMHFYLFIIFMNHEDYFISSRYLIFMNVPPFNWTVYCFLQLSLPIVSFKLIFKFMDRCLLERLLLFQFFGYHLPNNVSNSWLIIDLGKVKLSSIIHDFQVFFLTTV